MAPLSRPAIAAQTNDISLGLSPSSGPGIDPLTDLVRMLK